MALVAESFMNRKSHRGFTLIELLIALSIFGFLLLIAGPMYGDFMGNSQIRNGAENALTGVRLAQTEAVRGNTQTQFILDPTAAGGWQVTRFADDRERLARCRDPSHIQRPGPPDRQPGRERKDQVDRGHEHQHLVAARS